MKIILFISAIACSLNLYADDPLKLEPNYEFRVHVSPVLKLDNSNKPICSGILRRVKVEKGKEDLFDGDVAIGCSPILTKGRSTCPKAMSCKDAAYRLNKKFEKETESNKKGSGSTK